mgnify:CR=1 FL=1
MGKDESVLGILDQSDAFIYQNRISNQISAYCLFRSNVNYVALQKN